MERLEIRYRMSGKAAPPRAIRVETPGWGGGDQKMENGSEPQPWHCLPFVEASTYGLELVYPYETECHVVNDNGDIRFDWDYAKEPGTKLLGGEFVTFFPEPSKFYLFTTNLDMRSPPGHVIRTAPHPRFYTDDTGTVPVAIGGHVQTEWWPKIFFVVFKVPPPGQRHIFRKDEPYCQLLFVPRRADYELVEMTPDEQAKRRKMEEAIIASRSHIATNIWHNPSGYEFNNHYKLLARAFAREGEAGVEDLLNRGLERQSESIPVNKTIPECLQLAAVLQKEGKLVEARRVLFHVLDRDANNADAIVALSSVAMGLKLSELALKLARQAVTLQPRSASYQANLGRILFDLDRLGEAQSALRASLNLRANEPEVLGSLALVLSRQGQVSEAVQAMRAAMRLDPNSLTLAFRMGQILAAHGQTEGARVYFEAALALDPSFAGPRQELEKLSARSVGESPA